LKESILTQKQQLGLLYGNDYCSFGAIKQGHLIA
jgi:hypothetical protein